MLPRSCINDYTVNQCSETTLILCTPLCLFNGNIFKIVLRYFAKGPVGKDASASHMDISLLNKHIIHTEQ